MPITTRIVNASVHEVSNCSLIMGLVPADSACHPLMEDMLSLASNKCAGIAQERNYGISRMRASRWRSACTHFHTPL